MPADMQKFTGEVYSLSSIPLLERENLMSQHNEVAITTPSEDSRATAPGNPQKSLDLPLHTHSRAPFTTNAILATLLEEDGSETLRRSGFGKSLVEPEPPNLEPTSTWKSFRQVFWIRNRGSVLVVIAMFFGALMNLTTQLLENNAEHGGGMHPFQVSQASY